ncbi:MAG: choline-sulfatase [Anaerolineales bacterium]
MAKLNRRDFLKIAGAAAPAVLFPQAAAWAGKQAAQTSRPNVIILLFDAMSARNLSLYGYPRPTAPNLERFAERATVYHSHYAGGNFTVPGVGTLLTGSYPWTNRAFNHSGQVKASMAEENIFRAVGGGYHRAAFPQSVWSSFIAYQFANDIETMLPSETFSELDYLFSEYFPKDRNMANRAIDDFIFRKTEKASLLFGTAQSFLSAKNSSQLSNEGYPRGLPQNFNYPLYFRLEDLLSGVGNFLTRLPAPFFTYIHLFPPHAPYRPSAKFNRNFREGWMPTPKPEHIFSEHSPQSKLDDARQTYDEYIASVDFELGKLLDNLAQQGVLDDSYVIVTADHGEMFERGEKAHSTPLLFEPVIHVPLVISAPGQTKRQDVYAPTNAVDLLPTIAGIAGQPLPAWAEGQALPLLGGKEDYQRSAFTVEAKLNDSFAPLTKVTVAMRQGMHKLIYYAGYSAEPLFEFFDMEKDNEELNDLAAQQPAAFQQMKTELLDRLSDINKEYAR